MADTFSGSKRLKGESLTSNEEFMIIVLIKFYVNASLVQKVVDVGETPKK